ncbi:hypothetical protein PAXRUDRAFT_825097 [Paxillus rubicundulus Ve08.2h10]|uniref:Uncharacterized protein n=1 Tax=Paxillus rubicundulus Ve08.2h10 TaxID=930991 RepID=A0A0D0DTL5_9AGAM|nr:hypothetical protein PAXRUDRAFT_825097 [Paxillus rubicundulus Ve08.2h10]
MSMDNFSYTDTVRAVLASCLPCFASSPSQTPASNSNPNHPGPRPARLSSNDLEHLLQDTDSDALSLHSNFAVSHRRTRQRRRPKFSLTLFGYTLFGRPPVYLPDDEDEGQGARTRTLATTSSSTLDSDAAPLDASAIERLTSPDHHAALQRERERRRLEEEEEEEEARRKAERRARRQERKARERASALMALTGESLAEGEVFEGFQGSGSTLPPRPSKLLRTERTDGEGSISGEADDADLGGELYTRKKRQSVVWSGSGSDSRSRTSASLSAGDAPHARNSTQFTQQSIPYPHTQMHLPLSAKKKNRASKRFSTMSSTTSQSTSTAPYTPVESITESPAVSASPIPQERYIHSGGNQNFPITGLSASRGPNSLDARAFRSAGKLLGDDQLKN